MLLAGCAAAASPTRPGKPPSGSATDSSGIAPKPSPQPAFVSPTAKVPASTQASGSPPPTQPTTTFQPRALAFWNATDGLLGGGFEHQDGSGPGVIMRTSDGGRHWHSILSTDATVVELWVVPDRVWALTSCDAATSACAPRLLRSADGGVTWSASRTNLAWLSFGDPRDGWAAPTSGSSAYRTIDGGATWTRVRSPCADSPVRPLRALAFDSASMGLAVCAATLGAGGEFKSVLQTTDGGATWHVRASVGAPPIPSVGSVPYFGYVRGLVVAHDGAAWLWGDRMVPVESGDAGITWQPLGIGIPDALLVTAAWPLDARDGFVLLWDPNRQSTLVEVTADDGRTWQERASLPIATVPVVP